MNDSARFFIAALAAGLNDTAAPALPLTASWEEIVRLAESTHLCGLLLRGLRGMEARPPQAEVARLQACADKAAYTEAVQHFETERVCTELAEAGVWFCLLKGEVLRALYPSPEMREMVDVDMLIPPAMRETAKAVMLRLGYRLQSEDTAHDAYTLPPVMAMELHHRLLSEKSRYREAFAAPWTLMEPTDRPMEYRLPPTQEYLFLLLHMEKHLREAGVGVRDILDLLLYQRRYQETIDRGAVEKRLKTLGLLDLEQRLAALAKVWFEGDPVTPTLERIGDFVLESGVHGTIRQSVKQNYLTVRCGGAANTRAQYLLRRLFPPKEELEAQYPSLKRRPWLKALYLPRYWWRAAVGSAADTRARYRAMRDIDSDELSAHRQVMTWLYENTEEEAP